MYSTTVLCKKNANEFRRISVIVLSKFRWERCDFSPEISSKFRWATRKFERRTKIRKSNNEISFGVRTYWNENSQI